MIAVPLQKQIDGVNACASASSPLSRKRAIHGAFAVEAAGSRQASD
jgi:hypothetical protein